MVAWWRSFHRPVRCDCSFCSIQLICCDLAQLRLPCGTICRLQRMAAPPMATDRCSRWTRHSAPATGCSGSRTSGPSSPPPSRAAAGSETSSASRSVRGQSATSNSGPCRLRSRCCWSACQSVDGAGPAVPPAPAASCNPHDLLLVCNQRENRTELRLISDGRSFTPASCERTFGLSCHPRSGPRGASSKPSTPKIPSI